MCDSKREVRGQHCKKLKNQIQAYVSKRGKGLNKRTSHVGKGVASGHGAKRTNTNKPNSQTFV